MQHRKIASTSRFPTAGDRSAGHSVKQAPHPADVHVGRQITAIRIHSDFSQQRLAEKIGITYQQLQKYESGRNRVSASMLYEIGTALGVPAGRFFEGLPGNMTAAGETPQILTDERIVFIASAQGRRLTEGLMRLSPDVRSRLSSLITTLAKDMPQADGASSR